MTVAQIVNREVKQHTSSIATVAVQPITSHKRLSTLRKALTRYKDMFISGIWVSQQ